VPVELRKRIPPDLQYDTVGESVGFFRFDEAGARRLTEIVAGYVARGASDMPHEEAIRDLIREHDHAFDVADVTGLPWIEIDFPKDVARAEQEILPELEPE
jgi:choline kinase